MRGRVLERARRLFGAVTLMLVLVGFAPVGALAAPSDPASGIAPAGPAAVLTTPDGVRRALTPTAVAPGSAAAVDPAQLLAAAVGDDAPVPTSTAVRLLLFLTGLSFIPALVIVMTPLRASRRTTT